MRAAACAMRRLPLRAAFAHFLCLPMPQTMPYIAAVVRATCCGHPVAEVMLILWAMGHLIEGASGFGTGPATLTRKPAAHAVACHMLAASKLPPR